MRAGLPHDLHVHANVEQAAEPRYALREHDVELADAERWRQLVLADRDLGPHTDAVRPGLQRFGAADFQPHARIELQRAATRCGLRIAEEHADLLSDLVDEDDDRMALGDRGRELTQRLGHEPGLHTRQGVAHIPFDLRPWHERRHGVNDDQVHGTTTHQHLGDFQRLLAGIRLRDQQVLNVHATSAGPHRVERVLRVNEGGNPTGLLCRGDCVQCQCRLPAALRAVNLDHSTAGQTANPQSDVEGDNTRRDDTGVQPGAGVS